MSSKSETGAVKSPRYLPMAQSSQTSLSPPAVEDKMEIDRLWAWGNRAKLRARVRCCAENRERS